MASTRITRPWSRRGRGWLGLIGAGVAGAVLATLLTSGGAAVGSWDSAEGQDAHLAAYEEVFATMPRPAQTLDVRTDYGVVRVYRFTGSGRAAEPLVLLPGTTSGAPVWADNMASLLRVGDVYALDLLGEPGRSVQERPIASHEDEARWLDQTLAGLPEQRFNLVGLSIGGWTATNLAVRHPEQVASLTLLDPALVYGEIPLGTMLRAIPVSAPWAPRSWRDSFTSYTAGGAPVRDVPVARMIEAGMQHYRMRLPQPSLIPEDQLAALPMPVLAIVAGRSVMHDPATAEQLARRVFTGTDVVKVYPTATHAINGELPEEIAADISQLVARR